MIYKNQLPKKKIREIRRTYPAIRSIRGASCYCHCGQRFPLEDVLRAMDDLKSGRYEQRLRERGVV